MLGVTPSRPLTTPRWWAVWAATVSVLVAGCSSPANDAPDTDVTGFAALIEQEIDNARSSGASPHQIELLEAAQRDGVVSPETMSRALDAFAGCLEEAGLEFDLLAPTGSPEFPRFTYEIHTASEGETLVMDECSIQHVRFVDIAYQLQPAFDAARSAFVMSKREEIVACLDDEGVAIEPDATVQELRVAVLSGALGQDPRNDLSQPPTGPFYDCLGPVGLTLEDMMGELE